MFLVCQIVSYGVAAICLAFAVLLTVMTGLDFYLDYRQYRALRRIRRALERDHDRMVAVLAEELERLL